MRSQFQGVTNIVRFNWHFFAAAGAISFVALVAAAFLPTPLGWFVYLGVGIAIVSTASSLAVSWYVYDRSGLYSLKWLNLWRIPEAGTIVTINAGFDEVSQIIKNRLPDADLHIWDFYDEEKHTEISIKRAREAYPPVSATRKIQTTNLPLEDGTVDVAVLFMAAHEIRDPEEREQFFSELHRILNSEGKLIVTEHLRDFPNFAAYTVGAFHFYSEATWNTLLKTTGFSIWYEQKENPFVSTFVAIK